MEWVTNDCDHPTDAITRIPGPQGFECAIKCEDCGAIDV